MIWQDPVDYSHITYEYDHRCVMIKNKLGTALSFAFSLLEQEEGGTEARQLTQRACKVDYASYF